MRLKFIESARNPKYGTFAGKDEFGREKDLNLLELQLDYRGRLYKVGDLLEIVAAQERQIKELRGVIDTQEKQDEKIKDLIKLSVILKAEIDKLK